MMKLTDPETKNQMRQLSNLQMHQRMDITSETEVMRVPGGFLYITILHHSGLKISAASSFVPYHTD
jgi:hypothetical protein